MPRLQFAQRARRMPLCGVLLVLSAGCVAPNFEPLGDDAGIVWVFPGVEGGGKLMYQACAGIRDAGVEHELRLFDWERVGGTLANLTDYPGNLERAATTAEAIAAYRAANPGATIHLVGYSGGGGMAVFVLEALPDEVHVQNVVLAQPALSPDYDLTAALEHIDGKLTHYYSPNDWFILGAGTKAFGTMDREHVDSCGRVGFNVESAVPAAALRDRFEQTEWNAEMFDVGHYGGHIPILSYAWNRDYVAPHLAP